MRDFSLFVTAALFLFSTLAFAQKGELKDPGAAKFPVTPIADAAKSNTELPADLAEVVKKQFGTTFTIANDFPTPLLLADLDGDGIEDAVIVARSKKPPHDDLGYKLIDPYDEYFGMGDPRITVQLTSQDPDRTKYLLIIHGIGAEGWRAATPKAKFVVINLPFDRLGVERMSLTKKKTVTAISAEETSMMTSNVFWNGKKYKWEPNGMSE